MPTVAKPRRARSGKKSTKGAKAKPHKQRLLRRKLLIAPVVMVLPLALYFLGSDDAGQRFTVPPLSELQYRSDAVATASLGDEFTLDTFRYKVSGAVNRGRAYGFQKAEGKFVEVAIAVQNTGIQGTAPAALSLLDGAGTQYAQIPQFSRDGTSYSEILEHGREPGNADAFFALFDVASGSTDLWLAFHGQDGIAARIVQLGM